MKNYEDLGMNESHEAGLSDEQLARLGDYIAQHHVRTALQLAEAGRTDDSVVESRLRRLMNLCGSFGSADPEKDRVALRKILGSLKGGNAQPALDMLRKDYIAAVAVNIEYRQDVEQPSDSSLIGQDDIDASEQKIQELKELLEAMGQTLPEGLELTLRTQKSKGDPVAPVILAAVAVGNKIRSLRRRDAQD